MKKVLILGGVSYDTIIHMNEFPAPHAQTIHAECSFEAIGSTGSGKAFSFNKLGYDVTLHSMLGEDTYGDYIKDEFEDQGIRLLTDKDLAGTERHVNMMNENGERISIYLSATTFEPKIDYAKMEKEIMNHDIIVLNIINYCRHYIPFIKKQGKEIWCDLHDYDGTNPYHQDFIAAADYITMSSDNLIDYKQIMRSFIEQGKKIVICTHGKRGATALTDSGEWIEQPIITDYEVVDSNGAGDNFFVGFLHTYSQGKSVKEALQVASIVAGLCVTSKQLVSNDLSNLKIEEEYIKLFGQPV